jgi:predicted DNA-binding transcriptional regulator AlpA
VTTMKVKTAEKPVCMAFADSEAKTASPAVLLTPLELAQRLAVPLSWVFEKTRERARVRDEDPLPVVRLGKYVRFSWSAVEEWLTRQSER